MNIRELSFRSVSPIPSLNYFSHQVRLPSETTSDDQAKELGRLSRNLKRQYSKAIIANSAHCSILSPIQLDKVENAEIIEMCEVDLTSIEYRFAFWEACNFYLTQAFGKVASKPRIDFYKKRIYSKDASSLEALEPGKDIIEGQRYLTFDFFVDDQSHLVLALDFGSEFYSLNTLDQMSLEDLTPGQRLVQIYDNKSCDFVSISDATISDRLTELGNNSVLEYHQGKGNFPNPLTEGFNKECAAIKVQYAGPQGSKPFIAFHAPQLLRKLYDRSQVDSESYHNYLWPIQKKCEKAIETIKFLNDKNRFSFFENPIRFEDFLWKPSSLSPVNTGKKKSNLFFGSQMIGNIEKPLFVSYPSAALKQNCLLEKPHDSVKAVILSPVEHEQSAREYIDKLKNELGRFQIELKRAYNSYDPCAPIAIRKLCQEIKDCDVVIAFVPDYEGIEDADQDPYKIIKRQLVKRSIPSQMITTSMMKKGWNQNVGQNLILGINSKLGFVSWRINIMPGETDVFVGLDVSRKAGITVGASSFVFDKGGQLLEWSASEFQAYQECFDSKNLKDMILDLYSRKPFKRLVVHRDGKLQQKEFQVFHELQQTLKKEGLISLDVIEVIKSGCCRAASYTKVDHKDIYSNPPRGWIWKRGNDEAVILTTGDRESKVSENSSPRPLRIRHRIGEMDVLTLAEQVYWLSEMQVGSTQTIRLPITTYYADRAAEFVQEKLVPLGIQNDRRLWFI